MTQSSPTKGLHLGKSSVVVLMLVAVVMTYIIATYTSVEYQYMSDWHLMALNLGTLLFIYVLPILISFSQLFRFQGYCVPYKRIASMFFVGNAAIALGYLVMGTFGYNTIPAEWLLNYIHYTFHFLLGLTVQAIVLLNVVILLGCILLVVLPGGTLPLPPKKKETLWQKIGIWN